MGEILATEVVAGQPDFVLTMETKGIPVAFATANALGVPLVIACVRDTEKASRRLFLRPTKVYLDILETLPAEQVKAMNTRDLAEYSRNKILEVIKE